MIYVLGIMNLCFLLFLNNADFEVLTIQTLVLYNH